MRRHMDWGISHFVTLWLELAGWFYVHFIGRTKGKLLITRPLNCRLFHKGLRLAESVRQIVTCREKDPREERFYEIRKSLALLFKTRLAPRVFSTECSRFGTEHRLCACPSTLLWKSVEADHTMQTRCTIVGAFLRTRGTHDRRSHCGVGKASTSRYENGVCRFPGCLQHIYYMARPNSRNRSRTANEREHSRA